MSKVLLADLSSSQEGQQSRNATIQDAICSRILGVPGCVIGTSSAAKIKTTNTTMPFVNGTLLAAVASAEYTLPASTVTNAYYNVFVLVVSSAGVWSILAGTQATTLAGVDMPTIPAGSAVVGLVTVHPTGTGNFVGATTNFNDGTVVPNAVFIDCNHGFNPNAITF